MEYAALFGGQGSQYPGMGRRLREEYPAARRVYECGGDILGFDVAGVSEGAKAEELSGTGVAQPAIFTLSVAAFEAARERLPAPVAAAGHSLGEYAALCCAGCYSVEDGFRIIKARAEAMQEAAATAAGAMLAVTGLESAEIERVCARHGEAWAVNYNLPGQTVISGREDACLEAGAELAAMGARTVRLAVGSAFHTPLMEKAAVKFREMLSGVSFAPPRCAFYSNLTGDRHVPESFPEYFALHMTGPVLFARQASAMERDGVAACVEFGPKKTVSALARKNCREFAVWNVEDPQSLEKTAAAFG